MRSAAVGTFIAIFVVASFGVGYLAGGSSSRTAAVTSISTVTTTSATTRTFENIATTSAASSKSIVVGNATSSSVSPNGIELATSINATSLLSGQRLNITLSISNVLRTVNDVQAANDWPFQGVPVELWPDYTQPVQAAVLNGNYSTDSLQLLSRAKFQFVCIECATLDHVLLQPNSDLANVTGVICSISCDNETMGPYRLIRSFTTGGYWDPEYLANELNAPVIGTPAETKPYSMPFLPGVYTVAIGDEWGQVNVLHFQVQAKNHPPSAVLGGFSLCSSNCHYPAPFLTGTIYFNSTSPVAGFFLTVNGTRVGALPDGYPIPFTNVPFVYKQTLLSSVVAGDDYVITFQFHFEDNTTTTASTDVVAR